jgi:ATP-dependent Clp protease, protease subunit
VDIEIQAREIMYHKNNLNQIMADYTGQPFEKVGDGRCPSQCGCSRAI